MDMDSLPTDRANCWLCIGIWVGLIVVAGLALIGLHTVITTVITWFLP